MAKRKPHPWQQKIDWARAICEPLGCSVDISIADYEIAKVKGDGVSLVIYPHKTSAGHHHVRTRDNGSKDKARARQIQAALKRADGLPASVAESIRFSCTFSWKGMTIADMKVGTPGE